MIWKLAWRGSILPSALAVGWGLDLSTLFRNVQIFVREPNAIRTSQSPSSHGQVQDVSPSDLQVHFLPSSERYYRWTPVVPDFHMKLKKRPALVVQNISYYDQARPERYQVVVWMAL